MNPITEKYLQSGCCSPTDKLSSLLHTEIPYIRNARKAALAFMQEKILKPANAVTVELYIKPYVGTSATVKKIGDYLTDNLYDDLYGAYVHGSTGSNEMITYSDFDGIIILRDDSLFNAERIKRVALHLELTYKMMLETDPLQHHGWQIFSERDLLNYPDSHFPVELFRHAKSLLDKGNDLTFYISPDNDYKAPFNKLSQSLIKKTSQKCPLSLYEIKSLMSEFMLLPALYIQAKQKKGIFKGESFAAASSSFTTAEWKVMNEISALRSSWNYPINVKAEMRAWKYRRIPLISYYYHTAAPVELVEEVESLLPGMNAFLKLMQDRIK